MLSQQAAGCRQLNPHHKFASTQLVQPSKRHQPQAVRSRVIATAERYSHIGQPPAKARALCVSSDLPAVSSMQHSQLPFPTRLQCMLYCLTVSMFWFACHVHQVIVPSMACLSCCLLPSRPKQQLWRPDSQRSLLVPDKADGSGQIWCGQGPPPPSPMVVERFSQVISQLFQQVGNIS